MCRTFSCKCQAIETHMYILIMYIRIFKNLALSWVELAVDISNHDHIMVPMGNSNPVVKTTNMAIYHRTDKSPITVLVRGITQSYMYTPVTQCLWCVYEVFMSNYEMGTPANVNIEMYIKEVILCVSVSTFDFQAWSDF